MELFDVACDGAHVFRYLLRNRSEEWSEAWSDRLRLKAIAGLRSYLELLAMMQVSLTVTFMVIISSGVLRTWTWLNVNTAIIWRLNQHGKIASTLTCSYNQQLTSSQSGVYLT